ncbi:hypothetical protein WMY93_022270 [Mugilogobius chulae]|uniref:Transposase element L1Md-A101/L1Md-A102/L1Md-A2 n=1 Tax=Mugilogobius chulae TaxID=88201 RepID=A0AAW0N9H9_9GOBI
MPPKKANSGERTEITVGEAEHQHAGNREVLAAIAELRADLTKATSDICSTLRGEIATLRSENEAAISVLRKKFDRHDDKLKEMADSAESANNTVADLQTQVKQLTKQVEQLSEKCVDLEGRSKRQNIRIAGVKEGKEYGQRVSDFVAQLLKTTLALDDTPLLDRAHRALRVRPGDDEPPRHLIARVHYCHTLDEILRNPRNLLRDKPGVRFGLLYPAKLRVTHNGSEAVFTDPNEARRYAQERFGSG